MAEVERVEAASAGGRAREGNGEPLFDDEFLRKLELLRIVSQKLNSGQYRAERRARRIGSGLEFADYRGYVPGDDYRKIDWRAWLRLDRLILRLSEEEADLPIYIFLDASRSMGVEEGAKLTYAKKVAAALAYVGLANLDRVTLVAFADGLLDELPPQHGKGRIFKVFRFLSATAPSGADTAAEQAFTRFFTARRRRGLVVVVSDFFDPNGFQPGLDALRYRRHDVFAVHVVSPRDARPGLNGELTLIDSETRHRRDLRITPALMQAYAREFDLYCHELERYCSLYGFGYVRTATEVPFEDLILKIFRQGRFLS